MAFDRSRELVCMRGYLLSMLLIVLASSLLAFRTGGRQWERSWREELVFFGLGQDSRRVLQVEEDRYWFLEDRTRGWKVVDRGSVRRRSDEDFVFVSDSGGSRVAHWNGRTISGDWGLLRLKRQLMPRVKPDASWIVAGAEFSVGRVRPGMSRREVRKMYPEEFTFACRRPGWVGYGDFRSGLVEVRYDSGDRVARVRGGTLEQGGRLLFNRRSQRSDVQRTFPASSWAPDGRFALPSGSISLRTGEVGEVSSDFSCELAARSAL